MLVEKIYDECETRFVLGGGEGGGRRGRKSSDSVHLSRLDCIRQVGWSSVGFARRLADQAELVS